MLVILKIPIVYLCVVVWWAIKAEPRLRISRSPPSCPTLRLRAAPRNGRVPAGVDRSARIPRAGAFPASATR